MINYNSALSEIRAESSAAGLTFRRKNTRLNGVHLWQFIDRLSGRVVLDNVQFWTAYNNVCAGYIASYDVDTGRFVNMVDLNN